MLFWSRLPTFLEPQISLTLNPSLPSCMPSTLAAPSHNGFYFLNSLSLYTYRQWQQCDSSLSFIFLRKASWLSNPTPTLVLFKLSSVIINVNISFPVSLFLVSVTHPHHIQSQDDVKVMKTDVAHTNGQHLQENSKSTSTKWWNILEGITARRKTGNLYREMESVYFYLINVNLLSH